MDIKKTNKENLVQYSFFTFGERIKSLGMATDCFENLLKVMMLQNKVHTYKHTILHTISGVYGSRLRMPGIITEKTDFQVVIFRVPIFLNPPHK